MFPSPYIQECGYFEVGAVYLVIFITIGAFVFANLVVAVVVTNLVSERLDHSVLGTFPALCVSIPF